MPKIAKLGVRNKNPKSEPMEIVIRTLHDGTTYFYLTIAQFRKAWNNHSNEEKEEFKDSRGHTSMEGHIKLFIKTLDDYGMINEEEDKELLTQAMTQFALTPTFIERCGKTKGNIVKWVPKRKTLEEKRADAFKKEIQGTAKKRGRPKKTEEEGGAPKFVY